MSARIRNVRLLAGAGLALGLACGSAGSPGPGGGLSPAASLGEQIFKDTSLSASGLQSCATCHVAEAGHGSDNDLPAQLGGAALNLQGTRQSPTIRYLATNTGFHYDAEGTPTGGFFWDGRAETLADQAAGPFLNPLEMAMPSKAAVVAKLAAAPYAAAFRAAFGDAIFTDVEQAYRCMTLALQHYQREDRDFQPFSSKFDAFLRGGVRLTDAEARGMALFNDPQKGNCASCHPSSGPRPLFTDFTYDALGVPRNPALSANADPAYFDLGLGARPEIARPDLYGAFKVPTLRNVALRKALFHNGRFTSLTDAVTFYVQRDTHPEKWYPTAPDGTVMKFDDLPAKYHGNVNVKEVPYNRLPGQAPALTDAEVDDVVAFLKTLTDGYTR
ncbi:cytochrome-c peroxidase [Mesoterricola silvestris]|uniref:Di-heme cytochrome c peroxidase n=1 Tax=Mesoterricola silvestris TaxID=2927979 RepID=A0AA48GU58_9BACT|nr:cytochrome c peroxidase [Mesoterricola silvestris]BDU74117.1 di-heme cytochrome c peroxidase [Mesoterricola silvestris]